MDKTTHEVRLAQWKQIIEQCQARPKGQTAKQWLAENGISDKSYYYWLRKIWKQAYEQSTGNALPSAQVRFPDVQAQPAVSFVEIPFQPAGGWDADCIFHTRMRDFYDIYILTEQDIDVNAHVLAQA